MDRGTAAMTSSIMNRPGKMKANKKAMVGASTVLFAGALMIVFIFLVYSILINFSSTKTKDDINTMKSNTKMDQTVMALARTDSFDRLVFDLVKDKSNCKEIEAAARPILDRIFTGQDYWRLRISVGSVEKCNLYQRGNPAISTAGVTVGVIKKEVDIFGDSLRFSEQLLPNPYLKSDEDSMIKIRLDEYNYE